MRAFLPALLLCACAAETPSAESAGYGPEPALPAPKTSPLPVINILKAGAWAPGAAPKAPSAFTVTRFAEGLDHPRWLHLLPNGDVLVALSATEPGKPKSLKDLVMAGVQKRAGAAQESPDQIVLLRDADGDGRAEIQNVLLRGLNQPFGMLFLDGLLYVANTDAVVRYPYVPGQTAITAPPEKILDLPHGPGHWTRNILASPDGQRLFITVGSASNIADEGMEQEVRRAAILATDRDGKGERIFASGLRNPNGLAFEPVTGALWTTVNERDLIGDDLVPDYMTSVKEGAFYGWPYSYWGQNVDVRVKPPRPDLVAKAIRPDYGLGSHTASLGLVFYTAGLFPAEYRGGAFVAQHGSWNRSRFSGYKVLFVPFSGGRPSGPPRDFLNGFLPRDRDDPIPGRPVGLALDKAGALLVADDVGGIVWRVAPRHTAPAPPPATP